MAAQDPVSRNITWHHGHLDPDQRERLLGQRGAVVWFTGLSASGKSTVARQVERRLVAQGRNAYVLDGDNVRHGLNRDLGFSPEARTENIRRVGEVAKLMADASLVVLSAFISPYRRDRDAVRALLEKGRFFEVWVDVDLSVCEARDPKGIYKRARSGEIPQFTGISAPYEAPLQPELVLKTETESEIESCDRVIALLTEAGVLR